MFNYYPLSKTHRRQLLIATSFFAFSANSVAQTSQEQDIEVVEVYAQKRKQDLQDVSIAVNIVQGQSIAHQQIKDTTQLARFTPSMKITNNAGEGTPPAFNIRGVGMIDYNTSTISPIAIYNDGIVSGSANNLAVNLYDIEQIEVLRGPQGTLFGRNTTGGAILLRSKMPTQEFGGYFNAGIAQYDTKTIEGAVNLPITEHTSARFAFDHDDYQFSTNNLMPAQPDGGFKHTNARLIIRSSFDSVTATLKLHSEHASGKPKPIASNGIFNKHDNSLCSPDNLGSHDCVDAFGNQVGGKDYWDVSADTADRRHNTDSWGTALTLDWQIDKNIQLTSITGIRNLERFHSWDSDGPANLIEGSFDTDNDLFSQEIYLSLSTEQYFWQSGIYYIKEKINQNNGFDLFRDFRAVPALADIPILLNYDNKLENESVALYSQFDWSLSEKTTVILGMRYTDETTNYHTSSSLNTVNGTLSPFWHLNGKIDDDELSGKIALNHAVTNNINTYISVTRGYKSGGYNAGYSTSPAQAADSEYAPEILNAYELGSKLKLFNGNARWHLSAFYYDYKDQQVFINIPDSAVPYHVLKNAGSSTIYGLDSEFTYAVSHHFELGFNLGYLPKANIGKYQKNGLFVDDNRLPFSSKWNVSGYLLSDFELWSKPTSAQLSFDYQSDFYFDQNENPYTEQKGFTVINGFVAVDINTQLTVTLWGKNLTKTEYAELRFDSIAALGAVTELKGEDRQFGISANYRF